MVLFRGNAYALLTRQSIPLHSSGSWSTKPLTSSGLLTSSLMGKTLTPSPTSFCISFAICCSVSIRRAVKIKRRSFGDVRANSNAVLRPIPEEAPVMRIVLPCRRDAMVEVMMGRVEVDANERGERRARGKGGEG